MNALTLDIEMQSLEFALLFYGLALVQYFLTMFPFRTNSTVYPLPLYAGNM